MSMEALKLDFLNPDNPDSLINIAPKMMVASINQKVGLWITRDEQVHKEKLNPSATLNRLRISLWKEINRAIGSRRKIFLKNIYNGICSYSEFSKIVKKPVAYAWILRQPVNYDIILGESLNLGIDRLREILEAPLYKQKSLKVGDGEFEIVQEFDTSVANIILKTVAMLDTRVNGPIVKRLQIQSQNIPAPPAIRDAEGEVITRQINPPELVKKIEQLEAELSEEVVNLGKGYDTEEMRTIENDLNVNIDEVVEFTNSKKTIANRIKDKIAIESEEIFKEEFGDEYEL